MLSVLWLISFNAWAFEVEAVLDWLQPNFKSFYMTGTVEKVFVHSGQRVKKNQLLAQLDRRILATDIEKYKAGVKQLAPLIFDAQVEFNNAEELFSRTVLSEIDLQKKQGLLNRFQAQQAVAMADLKRAQIRFSDAQLKAPYDARLIRVDMVPGQVISKENMAIEKIILVQLGRMIARVTLSVDQAEKIHLGQKAKLNINGTEYQGAVISSEQLPDQTDRYTLNIEFEHNEKTVYLAGQKVSVEF